MEDDDVELGTVQTKQSHVSTEADGDAERCDLDLSGREKMISMQ